MGDKNISSRRAYSFLMRLMLAVLLLSAFAYVQAKEKVSPETRAKIDKIYSYNFTDLQKSLSLLRQLESAGQIEPYSSNEIRGDLYYNRGNFFESLKYYKRGLYDERASGDIAFQQKVIGKLLMCFDNNHNLAEMNRYAMMLKKLTADSNTPYMQSVVVFNEGKSPIQAVSPTKAIRCSGRPSTWPRGARPQRNMKTSTTITSPSSR